MAQEVYDGSEDHFARMKSEEDEAAKALFNEAAKNFGTVETDEQIQQLINDLHRSYKSTKSTYFENLAK